MGMVRQEALPSTAGVEGRAEQEEMLEVDLEEERVHRGRA